MPPVLTLALYIPLFGDAKFVVEPKSAEVFDGYSSLQITRTLSPSNNELAPDEE